MARSRIVALCAVVVAIAWIVRLNNALTYPSLRAFDGFGHFTYIWFMAENWRVPPPTSGWSFFHPPMYYWLMASIWSLFDGLDPLARLRIGTSLTATLGLAQSLVAFVTVRRLIPDRPPIAFLAAVLMLFLPVQVFTAGYLGNESLNAFLCAMCLLAMLWTVREPSWKRGIVLGALLGAALLTKFTAVGFAVGAFGSLALRTIVKKDWRRGGLTIAAAAAIMLPICGWFYARNIIEYHDPFKVSRDEFLVRRHENMQTVGRRDLLEYLLFDPLIVWRPQWPRGVPLVSPDPQSVPHSRLRESVWTGAFANTFFDAVGAQVLPPVTISEASRRAGQWMLTLGLVPTIFVVLGVGCAIVRIVRKGWDDTLVPSLLTFAAMVALFVSATRAVPMNAAVKATYLTPASALFALWFAVGVDRVTRPRPRLLRAFALWAVVFAISTVVVFTNGVFIARHWLEEADRDSPVWKNIYGVIYYAAGQRDRARELFEAGVAVHWHLSNENLASLALEEDRPLEALYHLRAAARDLNRQAFGTPADRLEYIRVTQAEYQNKLAVTYHRLGWHDAALDAARKAYELDRTIPEVSYDLAVLTLADALRPDGSRDESRWHDAVGESRRLISEAVAGDPAYFEARALAGSAAILAGECTEGFRLLHEELSPHPGRHRFYPLQTGQGDIQASAIRRRMHIVNLPEGLRPASPPAHCSS